MVLRAPEEELECSKRKFFAAPFIVQSLGQVCK